MLSQPRCRVCSSARREHVCTASDSDSIWRPEDQSGGLKETNSPTQTKIGPFNLLWTVEWGCGGRDPPMKKKREKERAVDTDSDGGGERDRQRGEEREREREKVYYYVHSMLWQ